MQMYSKLMWKLRCVQGGGGLKLRRYEPGGGKSLKSRIVHGMFTAIASRSWRIYTGNLSNIS